MSAADAAAIEAAGPAGEGGLGLRFAVDEVRPAPAGATPALDFGMRVVDPDARPVFMMALRCQLTIDPADRSYDADERTELAELFGDEAAWSPTASLVLAERDVLVQSFRGETAFRMRVPFSYDHELAVTRYCGALRGGEIPIRVQPSGSVYYGGADGRLQIVLVPWACEASVRLPVALWRDMMRAHYPEGDWIRLAPDTRARLHAHRRAHGHTSFDAAVASLLRASEERGAR